MSVALFPNFSKFPNFPKLSLLMRPFYPSEPFLPLGAIARRRNACSLTTNNSLGHSERSEESIAK